MAKEHLCSYNHPCMIGDDTWRDLPLEKQTYQSCKGLPDIKPLATNGILVYGLTLQQKDTVYHLENIIFEQSQTISFKITDHKPKPPRLSKAKKLDLELERLRELASRFL